MKKAEIAILGGTSHIAKGLIHSFLSLHRGEFFLHLYTSSSERVRRFLDATGKSAEPDYIIHEGYSDFTKCSYDVVINCVGVGTQGKLQGDYTKWFMITEQYDNMVIEYLRDRAPDAVYINFSSGAVYGNFSTPSEENTMYCIRINRIAPGDYYGIVKLYTECKHRSFENLNIVDLRVFSYFSRFIDLKDGYFITDVLNCVLNKKVLVTDTVDIVRDYVAPEDLFALILRCMAVGRINKALDVISAKPVQKSEILEYFSQKYGLKYETGSSLCQVSATGAKNIYFSTYNNAAAIGYKSALSSMDAVKRESEHILRSLTGD
ncbi:MAG: NAD-dependent epimerase/dehydratase family protein [Nitrospirae bacterium YQR-1]